jgi:hypothetical protein
MCKVGSYYSFNLLLFFASSLVDFHKRTSIATKTNEKQKVKNKVVRCQHCSEEGSEGFMRIIP